MFVKIPTFPCDGGCACGAVRYRLLEEPIGLHVCHCTDCQTVTGTAFVLSMPMRRRALELIQGQPRLVEFTTRSGIQQRNRCCTDCSTRLWSERETEYITFRPGTLDDTEWLTPVAHIWTSSAQPWVQIPENVLCFEKGVDDYTDIAQAWKRRNDK